MKKTYEYQDLTSSVLESVDFMPRENVGGLITRINQLSHIGDKRKILRFLKENFTQPRERLIEKEGRETLINTASVTNKWNRMPYASYYILEADEIFNPEEKALLKFPHGLMAIDNDIVSMDRVLRLANDADFSLAKSAIADMALWLREFQLMLSPEPVGRLKSSKMVVFPLVVRK